MLKGAYACAEYLRDPNSVPEEERPKPNETEEEKETVQEAEENEGKEGGTEEGGEGEENREKQSKQEETKNVEQQENQNKQDPDDPEKDGSKDQAEIKHGQGQMIDDEVNKEENEATNGERADGEEDRMSRLEVEGEGGSDRVDTGYSTDAFEDEDEGYQAETEEDGSPAGAAGGATAVGAAGAAAGAKKQQRDKTKNQDPKRQNKAVKTHNDKYDKHKKVDDRNEGYKPGKSSKKIECHPTRKDGKRDTEDAAEKHGNNREPVQIRDEREHYNVGPKTNTWNPSYKPPPRRKSAPAKPAPGRSGSRFSGRDREHSQLLSPIQEGGRRPESRGAGARRAGTAAAGGHGAGVRSESASSLRNRHRYVCVCVWCPFDKTYKFDARKGKED